MIKTADQVYLIKNSTSWRIKLRELLVESENIQALIWTDNKMTYEKLRVINETTYQMMGDILPELEWRRVH